MSQDSPALQRPAALLVVALLLATLSACSRHPPHATRMASKILVVGIDGLEPSLLDHLLKTDRLPTFRALIDSGSLTSIDCVVGTTSPVVWTTVATGVAPREHGITGFEVNGVPVASTLRSRPAFWNILSTFDIPVMTIGWMVTWPAETDGGTIVSDRAHWGNFPAKVVPEDVIDTDQYRYRPANYPLSFLSRFTNFPFNPEFAALPKESPDYTINFLLRRRLIDIYARDTIYASIALDLLDQTQPDLLAVYFQGVDYVSHGFWQFMEPEPFREEGWSVSSESAQQLGKIIPSYYEYVDELVGRILKKVDDETLVILLSDHGFGTALGRFAIKGGDHLSGNHRFTATLILSGPQIERAAPTTAITHYDILPTILYALGLPQARDVPGRPLLEFFSSDFTASREVSYVESYKRDTIPTQASPSEHDGEILDELRSLGYIE